MRQPLVTPCGYSRKTYISPETVLPTKVRWLHGSDQPASRRQAEVVALATHIELARVTGARLHVCRVSAAESVAMIRDAKARGIAVTADVSINHLHLIDIDIGHYDSNFRLSPPLRTARIVTPCALV